MEHQFEITFIQDHPFRAKDPKAKRKLCVVCGKGRDNASLIHYGAPPALDIVGPGMDPNPKRVHGIVQAYQGMKQAYQAAVTERLEAVGMPKDLQAVLVEGLIGFPTLHARDQGNFRFLLEKAIGDALKEGGWLLPTSPGAHDDDCFYPVMRYEFGGLRAVHTPHESSTRLMFFPTLKVPELVPAENRTPGTLFAGTA